MNHMKLWEDLGAKSAKTTRQTKFGPLSTWRCSALSFPTKLESVANKIVRDSSSLRRGLAGLSFLETKNWLSFERRKNLISISIYCGPKIAVIYTKFFHRAIFFSIKSCPKFSEVLNLFSSISKLKGSINPRNGTFKKVRADRSHMPTCMLNNKTNLLSHVLAFLILMHD